MAFGAQPQLSRQYGPSAEQMAISQMGQFAQQPNSLAGILSQLNAITAPSMSPYGGGGTNVLVMPQTQLTTSRSGGAQGALQAGANGAGAASQASTPLSSSQLTSLGSTLGKSLSDILGGGSSLPLGMAGTAPGAAGLPSGLSSAGQQALSSAFTAPAVSGSLADVMGQTAGSLAPLAASQMAPVTTGLASSLAGIGSQAGSQAASEIASALGTQAAPAAAAPAAAAPAASGASAAGGMGAGALLADAGALGALGWMGYGATHGPANNGWSLSGMHDLLNSVNQATKSGLINPSDGVTGSAGSLNLFNPNGSLNQPLASAVQNLYQAQMGDFGPATQSYIKPALNAMGYQNIQQAAAGKTLGTGAAAPSSSPLMHLIRRY